MRPRERARLAQERAERAAKRARELDDRVAQLLAAAPMASFTRGRIQAPHNARAAAIANSVEMARAATLAAGLASRRAAYGHERAARAYLRAAQRYREAAERAGPDASRYRTLAETCLHAAQRKQEQASAARQAPQTTTTVRKAAWLDRQAWEGRAAGRDTEPEHMAKPFWSHGRDALGPDGERTTRAASRSDGGKSRLHLQE